MIAQVLNRDFILDQLNVVKEELGAIRKEFTDNTTLAAGSLSLDPAEVNQALGEVSASLEREHAQSSGQPVQAGSLRSGAAPLDDFSFFSRDPLINNLQSALDMYFREKEPNRLVTTGVHDDRRSGTTPSAVTDEIIRDWRPKKMPTGRRIFEKFSILDARWVSCKLAERWAKRHGPHKFVPPPNMGDSVTVPDQKLRLIAVGDWATGLPRAKRVSSAMRSVIETGKRDGLAQHVIHLGDTYYSGWPEEYEKRFLPDWPVDDWERDTIGSWSLNGNHDMYSGGYGYYDVLLADSRFHRQRGSSVFAMHNTDWQIIGLDSSYLDEDLKDQGPWLHDFTNGSTRKFLLLSHHQFFSAWESANPHLQNTMAPAMASGKVKAWFWGHEHRCVIYQPHNGLDYGRCIGHGGVPVYMWHGKNSPYKPPAIWEYRDRLPGKVEPWGYMGFAVLDFNGPNIDVSYFNENGMKCKNEQIH